MENFIEILIYNLQYRTFYWIAFVNFLILCASMYKNNRKFRNAFLFMSFLFFLFIGVIASDTPEIIKTAFIIGFVFLTMFLIFVVPVLLIINGFTMIRKEGFHLTNLLALFFGVVILLGVFSSEYVMFITTPTSTLYYLIASIFSFSVFFFSMVFLAFMFYGFLMRIIPRRADYDYVIVLGAGLINGDKVSKLLGSRIEKGIKVYQKSYSACKLIMSGGKGADEKISEAQAMKDYAVKLGVDPSDIIVEDDSKNTFENLRNCQKIMKNRGGRQLCAYVTSSYHVLRAGFIATRLNLDITGIASHVAFYYWPTAITREYAGVIKHYWKPFLISYLALFIPYIIIILGAI